MTRHTIGRWVLAITLVESALAVGTVHASALIILVILAAIAAALLFKPEPMRVPAKILVTLTIGLTVFTVVQLVPMPASWVAQLSPHAADIWSRALRPLGQAGPTWVPLTVDPVATRVQAARGIAYTLTLLAALGVARSRSGVRFLVWMVIVSGSIITIAALIHPAFEQHKVFGMYTPHSVIAPRHIGPLLNANHLSAYLNVTLCCATAVALDRDLGRLRILPGAIAVLVMATQLWVASRGGVVSMVVGVGAVAALRFLRARSVAFGPLMLGLFAIGGVVMAVYGQWDEAWNEIADTDVSKVRLFTQVLPMLRAFPIFGVGRGAFESSFPEFRTSAGYDIFTHPENVLLQWSSEWGVPVALVAIGAVVVALRPSVALVRGRWAVGGWAALAAVALHNLVDFSSETPGVVIALCVCAAVVVGGNPSKSSMGSKDARVVWLPAIAAAVVGVALASASVGYDVERDRNMLVAARGAPKVQFERDVRSAILRHPAEPYLFYVGGLHAHLTGESVIPWVERVLERAPVYGPAHLLLARELSVRSRAQARLEDRIGIEQIEIRDTTNGVITEAVKAGLVRSYEDAIELVPNGRERDPVLEGLSALLISRLPATVSRLDALRAAHDPPSARAAQHRAEAGLSDLRAGASSPWCDVDRSACSKAALEAARVFESVAGQSCESHALEANVRVESGEASEAFLEFRRFTRSIPQQGPCLAQLAQVAILAKLPSEADDAIAQVAHAPCGNQDECSSNLLSAAALEMSRNKLHGALAYYEKAAEASPDRDEINIRVAELAMSVGMYRGASDAYQRLLKRHPESAAFQNGLKQANQSLLELRVDDVSSGSP